MSYSCMAGRCGTCRCKVIDGEVLDGGREVQRPLDGRDAYVLACQTFITEPCTIEIPEPDEIVVHPARIIKATVAAIEDMTHDIKRLRAEAGQADRVLAGPVRAAAVHAASTCARTRWRACAATACWSSMSGWCRTAASPATSPTS